MAGKPALLAALWVTRQYRPSFHGTSPTLYEAADRMGIYPLIDHYHEPLAVPSRHLGAGSFTSRPLPGIDLRVAEQLALLERLNFGEELLAIPKLSESLAGPYYENRAFPPADAQILHGMIRHFRPKVILEVGSGESTRFAANAVRLNTLNGSPCTLRCIEPFEAQWLEQLDVDVRRIRIEEVTASSVAGMLAANDILFIDSSHVARPAGDVPHLYGEILPLLAPGVIVHVHDIFTPRNYPESWVQRRWLWDEQYIVEALLTKSEWLEVLLTVNCLYHDHSPELAAACPAGLRNAGGEEPCSLWLRVRGQAQQ